MGRTPTKAADNVYCKCRLEASKHEDRLRSREGAAELLGLSFSTLSDYELGNTKVVPPDSILRMADLYTAPELKNYYCRNECPIGVDFPEVKSENFDRTTVKAMSMLNKIEWVKDTLIDIAEDGMITEDEQEDFKEVLRILEDLSAITEQLKLHGVKSKGGR